ncbi:hypothetical protein P3T25_008707 [Paraburkholderia sp. GAS32]
MCRIKPQMLRVSLRTGGGGLTNATTPNVMWCEINYVAV